MDIFDLHPISSSFKDDILRGLSTKPKYLPSKYLYDVKGGEIYNQITHHPDYYLTLSELEILKTYQKAIAHQLSRVAKPFHMIELGPGEGVKSTLLIEALINESVTFKYQALDINEQSLKDTLNRLQKHFPKLQTIGIHADFFHQLEDLKPFLAPFNFVLFLGSSIGNFKPCETLEFLQNLSLILNQGDYVLLGFDLWKNKPVLNRAYDDSDGLTKAFNLNILHRINREFVANFDLKKFSHQPVYNAKNKTMESYLISKENQDIYIHALDKIIHFEKKEPIHIENSHKYTPSDIKALAKQSGFSIIENYYDTKHYFVDSLWRVDKKIN